MRWFKHFSDAGDDEVMAEMIEKFGLESYGLWWRILEIIARQMEKGSDRCSATYPKRKWRDLCSIYHQSRFDLVTIFLASREYPKLILSESFDNLLTISCPKLLKFRDEYSRKSGQTPDKIRTDTGQTPSQDTETELDTETDTKTEKKKKKQKTKQDFILPEWIDLKLWEHFVASRSALKKPLTNGACELVVKKLEGFKAEGLDPDQLLRTAIEKGWLTVYPPNGHVGKTEQQAKPVQEDKYAGITKTINNQSL